MLLSPISSSLSPCSINRFSRGSRCNVHPVSASSSTICIWLLPYSHSSSFTRAGCLSLYRLASFSSPSPITMMAGMSCPFTRMHFLLKSSTTLCWCMNGVPISTSYQSILTTSKYSGLLYLGISTFDLVPKLIFDQLPIVSNCSVTGSVRLNTIAFDRSAQFGDIAVEVLLVSHNASTVNPFTFSHIDKHCLSSREYCGQGWGCFATLNLTCLICASVPKSLSIAAITSFTSCDQLSVLHAICMRYWYISPPFLTLPKSLVDMYFILGPGLGLISSTVVSYSDVSSSLSESSSCSSFMTAMYSEDA